MKLQVFSTIILALVAATSFAQGEKKDSITTFHDIDSVVISDNGKQVSVMIKGAKNGKDAEFLLNEPSKYVEEQDMQYSTSINEFRIFDRESADQTKPTYHLSCNLGLDLGMIRNESGSSAKVNSFQSAEISWLNALKYTVEFPHRRNALSIGLGFTWRNFRRTDDRRFCSTNQETFYIGSYPEGSKPRFSRFKVFSISVPLLWEHTYRTEKTAKGNYRYKFQLGPVLNFNNYSSVMTRYDLNDKTITEVAKPDQLVPITLDLYGAIDIWKGLGIYARMAFTSLTDVTHSYDYLNHMTYSSAPEMHPISLGIKWGF